MKLAICISLGANVLAKLQDAAKAEHRPVSQVANAWLLQAASAEKDTSEQLTKAGS